MQAHLASETHASWPAWAAFLRRWGLENLAIWLLEAASPLTLLGAQALYFGQPLLRPAFQDGQIENLANLLEDGAEGRAFAAFLREEGMA